MKYISIKFSQKIGSVLGMRNRCMFIISCVLVNVLIGCKLEVKHAAANKTNLVIRINDIGSYAGNIRICLYSVNYQGGYPQTCDSASTFAVFKIPASSVDRDFDLLVPDVEPGGYAVYVHADKDADGELTKNYPTREFYLGFIPYLLNPWPQIPIEGQGFSTYDHPAFIMPNFKKNVFIVKPGKNEITVKISNFWARYFPLAFILPSP